ncbi:MAG: site-2 protease family protein [Desulfurococcales archaeon]|nr:site-2 protease family protein [Desulfurococcales archaeon]
MGALAIGLLSYLALWVAVTTAARGRRGRWEVNPIAVIYRFGGSMEPLRGRGARAISRASYASVALAYALMAFFYYTILATFWARYVARLPGSSSLGVVPLIPGVTVPLSVLPHFLVALGIAAAVHELAHALVARAEGLRVKNVGVALFIVVPAAFVELDEEELAKAPLSSRLKVYSAGVTANLILYLLLLGIASAAPCSAFSHGVTIIGVAPESPAAHAVMPGGLPANITRGDVIIAVNGEKISCIQDLARVFEEAGVKNPRKAVNLTLTLVRDGKHLNVTVYKGVNETMIGITIVNNFTLAGILLYSSLLLNFALALINAGPLFITDGAKMLEDLLVRLQGSQGKIVSLGLQSATVLLLLSLLTIRPILPG